MKLTTWCLAMLGFIAAPLATPPSAHACGGFFCNAQNPTPVIQAGERILFASHDGLVTMHIEITYQGDPTSFGWLLPLSQRPMDELGRLLPLDQVVRVSSQRLFPLLQSSTDPQFLLQRDPNDTTACSMPDFGGAQDSWASADAATNGDTASPNPQPPVTVLEEADVGPFRAQLIEATRSDALYTWLGDNGYIQDPNAQPILDHYVGQGFVFVGLKLQSGKSTGDLRPISITLGENAPCVPLVLTSIAASNDMPILVWVLGPSRAIPKNFLHAVIDPRAFAWPGAANYQAILSTALDALGGRAWVTEFSGPTGFLQNRLAPRELNTNRINSARNLLEVLVALSDMALDERDPDVALVLRDKVPMPEGLRGYPNGNCYQCQGCDWAEDQCAAMGMANADHETTEDEFYAFLFYWVTESARQGLDLQVDLPALKSAFIDEVLSPLQRLEGLFARSKSITRFFAKLSPDEMTRDPVFAFNPDLPDVSNVHTALWDLMDCYSDQVIVTYPDGLREMTSCVGCQNGFGASIPGRTTIPPLRFGEILDETGAPVPFDPAQASEMDRLVGGATVGQPTIPSGFDVQPPPVVRPVDPPQVTAGGGGCSGGPMSVAPVLVLCVLAFAARRSRAGDGMT